MNQTQHYRRVPNLNLIPLEFRRRLFSPRLFSLRVLLAVLVGISLLANALLYRDNLAIKAATDESQRRIEQTNARLAEANLKREDAGKIQAEIGAFQREAVSLKEEFRQLQAGQGWPRVLSTVFSARTTGVDLNSIIKQGTDHVAISGNATSFSALLQYRSQLIASKEIATIISLSSEKGGASFSFSILAQVEAGAGQ